jgi:hypothetical protein
MSQQTATARVALRAPTRRQTSSQPLRVVPAAVGQPGNAVFAVVCMALLIGGLFALLMLNTAMAEGSFTLHRLQSTSGELTDAEEALTQAIDAQRSPANLATRAHHLGMVPASSAAFLRLSDGKVLGVASPAKEERGFTVVTAPEAPSVKATKKAGAEQGTTVVQKGDVTTTSVVVTKPDGSVVTTVTSVDARTKATTSTTTTRPPTADTKPAKPTTGAATDGAATPASPAQ